MDLQVRNKIRTGKKGNGCLSKNYMQKFGFYLGLDNGSNPNFRIYRTSSRT